MIFRARSLACVGGCLLLLACESGPPNMEAALTLYRDGQINPARRELLAYIVAYPVNPESGDARQRILLIRRIKALEAEAVARWRQGDLEGARRARGVMRVLHPVYVDSARLFRLLDFDHPPRSHPESALRLIDPADSSVVRRLPLVLTFLDRQEEAIIMLAREREAAYQRRNGSSAGPVLSGSGLLRRTEAAQQAFDRATAGPDALSAEIERLAGQFNRFMRYAASGISQPPLRFEYGLQGYKRDLLMQILALKSHLAYHGGQALPPAPATADTSG